MTNRCPRCYQKFHGGKFLRDTDRFPELILYDLKNKGYIAICGDCLMELKNHQGRNRVRLKENTL